MPTNNVFISYAREDSDAAIRLYADLRDAGLQPWLDKESLLPGQRWQHIIRSAIKESRFFIALLSSRSVDRPGFSQSELVEAIEILGTYAEKQIYMIPVRLDECQPSHEKIRDLNWVDMFPSWELGLRKIIRAINRISP